LKKVLSIALKLGFAVFFGYLVVFRVDISQAMALLPRLNLVPGIVGWGLIGTGLLTTAWRWKLILRNAGIGVGFMQAFRLTYIGAFFSTFLPGSTGGDLAKSIYVWKQQEERKWEGVTTVLIDRAIGFCTLFAIASLCLSFQLLFFQKFSGPAVIPILLFSLAACGVGFMALLLWGSPLVKCLNEMLPERIREHRHAIRFLQIYSAVTGDFSSYLPVLVASAFSQLFLFLGAYLVAFSVAESISLPQWLVYFPVILAASTLPITFFGIGIREYLFVLFAATLAFPSKESALAASLLIFLSMLSHNALGGIVYFFSRSSVPVRNRKTGGVCVNSDDLHDRSPAVSV